MPVLFRPYQDLTAAPAPRCDRDTALHAFLSERTGLRISPAEAPVDYEDWTEPAMMLAAALRAGCETLVLPRKPLEDARATPIAHIPGTACADILIGRTLTRDALEAGALAWPATPDGLADHYAALHSFQRHAGRRVALADMPGTAAPYHMAGSRLAHAGNGLDLAGAAAEVGGRDFFVKQLRPAKAIAPLSITLGPDEDPAALARKFTAEVGFHILHHEGERDVLLVQERIEMRYEMRFFVIGHEVITGAGCIESDTPLDNTGTRISTRLAARRNRSPVENRPETAFVLADFAHRVARDIRIEWPDLADYALDVALGPDDRPLVVELNTAAQSGLFAIDADALMGAILARAQA